MTFTKLNTTEERFLKAVSPRFQKHRKQYRAQRAIPRSIIAAQRAFHATFHVTEGQFTDETPSESDTQRLDPNVPGVLSGSQLEPTDEFVEMKGVFVSKQCQSRISLVLSTVDTVTLFCKAVNYTLPVTVVAFIQDIVLIRQMEMTSTQAGTRRVSLMTVGLQAVADSYLCLVHLTMSIAVQPLFNVFAIAAFFKFICFSIFLMR